VAATPALRTLPVVIQRDVCTDSLPFSGEGETSNQTREVAGDLSLATLTATVPVADVISRQTFTFEVNLVWKAKENPQFLHSK
jgi:hypothetical protein